MGQVKDLKDFKLGQLGAALMKIGQDAGMGTAEGINAFLRGELVVSKPVHSWSEKNNVIRLSRLFSDGTSGPDWIIRLKEKGFCVSDFAEGLLRSPDFNPTNGESYDIVILKGKLWDNNSIFKKIFWGKSWTTERICAEANRRKLIRSNAEIACLMREKLSDEELEAMGLQCIIAMHEPINALRHFSNLNPIPNLLAVSRSDDGRCLDSYFGGLGRNWHRDDGFAFVVSSTSTNATADK